MQVVGIRVFPSLIGPIIRDAKDKPPARREHSIEFGKKFFRILNMLQSFKGNDRIEETIFNLL